MSLKIHSASTPLFTVDADTAEGRDGIKEAEGAYQLSAHTWLPFAAKRYHISPRIEDYLIVATIMLPSDIPNRNGIAFPLAELVKFQPPPVARQVYKAWAGCPVHLEHDNEDCTKAYGAVLDTSLHKIEGFGQGKLWKVMGLTAIDKTKHPDIAQKVKDGILSEYSIGALAERFECSYCKSPVSKFSHCHHVQPEALNFTTTSDWEGKEHLVYLNALDLSPIEFSIVADPAWTAASSDQVWDGLVTSKPVSGVS